MKRMRIYFSGSIRGGREDLDIYTALIEMLHAWGTVHSDHAYAERYVASDRDREWYLRDMEALQGADVLVAEVTQPSLGVGYQIGRAQCAGKRVLCLYRMLPDRQLSAMLTGNDGITLCAYTTLDDAKRVMAEFFGEKKKPETE